MTIKEPIVPSAPMESERDIDVHAEATATSTNNNATDYGVAAGDVPIAQAVAIDAPEPYVPNQSNSIGSSTAQQSGPVVATATPVPQAAAAATATTTTSYTVPPPNSVTTPQASGPPRPSGSGGYVPGLSMKSARVTCPYCREQAVTNTKSQIDCCTIIGVIVMVLVFWPLFWIPFICPCCKTTEHYCSKCHRKIGQAPPCNC